MAFLTQARQPTDRTATREFVEGWPTLLAVDDDPSCIAGLERSFRPYMLNLQRAYHGMQGIVDAVAQHPDVILTDLQMPLASGEELIECLTRNPATSGTPIIVLTGHPARTLTPEMQQMGVAAVLHKPQQFDELLDILGSFIDIELRNSEGRYHS